jgi:hypothetical protein
MSELTVDTGAMRAHANALQGTASGLREASDAASSMLLPDASFGLLCSFLVPMVNGIQGIAAAGVDGTADAVEAEQGAIRASAAAYDTIDELVGDALRTFKELLP